MSKGWGPPNTTSVLGDEVGELKRRRSRRRRRKAAAAVGSSHLSRVAMEKEEMPAKKVGSATHCR